MLRHLVGELFVFRRIDVGNTAAEHCNRAAFCVDGSAVADGIDASRQTTHDRDAIASKGLRQSFRHRSTVAGAVASSHHSDRELVGLRELPANKEHDRRVR